MKVGVAADIYIVYKSVYKEFERAVLDKKKSHVCDQKVVIKVYFWVPFMVTVLF